MGGGVCEFSFGNPGVPFIHSFAFCGFSSPWSTVVWKQTILLLPYCQKVNSSLMLCPNAYGYSPLFISSRRHFTTSQHHKKKGEYRTIRYFDRERPHPHNFYIRLLYVFYFISSYYCSSLLVPNL